jgi:lysine/ornithine N-monooxygenase
MPTHQASARIQYVDLLGCATGYDPMSPERLLAGLGELRTADETGRPVVRRDYRLATAPELLCGGYGQGGTEQHPRSVVVVAVPCRRSQW